MLPGGQWPAQLVQDTMFEKGVFTYFLSDEFDFAQCRAHALARGERTVRY